jgi:hypothetical protein
MKRQTIQNARQAGGKARKAPDSRMTADTPPASKKLPPASTDEGTEWTPPSRERLQQTLELLWEGDSTSTTLRNHLDSLSGREGKPGRFMPPEDWRIIAWAVNAWTMLQFPETLMRNEESLTQYDAIKVRRAGKRAEKMWRD